jgi:hypothetical protein
MQADNVARALLALILVCLLFLLGRTWGGGSAADDESAVVSGSPERFIIRPVSMRRGSPLLLRVDTATGQVWQMGLMDEGRWGPLLEGPDGVPSPGATEPGRYSIRPVGQRRGGPTLVRTDAVTGRNWRKGSTSKGPWVLIPNPPGEASAGEAPPAREPAEEAAP